ncbi:SARP family transcriptional regulator [Streptomyces olivaceoviridis]|uniref:ATP-binding protein n=1 Tax=Streptomyces olivaceoviridis TaxID=1921 RepID=UPI001677EDF1|nr:helix-turn-helix domain-containing protein [Streptomyces olivaceoviridis]GGZ19237.1 SARP family transcriptional regulator [Streptomyces olivaceoviridis]
MEAADFGGMLREARSRAMLTIEGLAEASGLSVRAVSNLERGRSVPRPSTLAELMDALGLDEDERRALTDAARGQTSSVASVPRQLPPDLRVFRGREEVLARVLRLTDEIGTRPGHVLITAVGGMGGVGKTTLAVHWAHRVADRFPDGQLYVDLRGFDPADAAVEPQEVLGGFLRALGMPADAVPEGLTARAACFREQVSQRRLVLLLDNARDSEQVRPLLPGAAGCLTVVTSRKRLTGLAALNGAHTVDLDVWTHEEAMAGLAARIGADRTAAASEDAAELVELCGRLPLAVAVIGAGLAAEPTLPLRAVVEELAQAASPLDALTTDDPRADVRAVLSWSYRALDPAAARLFRHLAALPGPAFSAEAAASAAGEPVPEARRMLRALTTASLLTRDAEGGHVLHDLVRAHAQDLWQQADDDRFAAQQRLLEYLHHHARSANSALGSTRQGADPYEPPGPGVAVVPLHDREQGAAWFAQEEHTIMAALRAANDDRLLRLRMHLARVCTHYFQARGRWADERAVQRLALDTALLLDDAGSVCACAGALAYALAASGDHDQADAVIEVAEGHLDRAPVLEQSHTRHLISLVREQEGRYAEALEHARAALELDRCLGDPHFIGRGLNTVAWCLTLTGRHREALAACEEAIPLLQSVGYRLMEAATWDTLGYALQQLGEPGEAVAHFETSARMYGEVFNRYQQAAVLGHLAEARLDLGEHEAARTTWLRAAALLDELGNPEADAMRARADAVSAPVSDRAVDVPRGSEDGI